jgi:hypothetical protein
MFLLFLCPGTIIAPSCRTSCQATSSLPPSSGSVGAASSHPFSSSTTAPTPSYAAGPAPSPSESGPGTRSSPSAASRLVRPRTPSLAARVPRQAAGFAPRRSCRHQAGLVFRTAGFYTFLPGFATRRSRNNFPTRRGGFCTPGTGGALSGATDALPVPSMGTAKEVGPLTYSPPSRGQSSGGALWKPANIPSRWSD